MLEVKQNTSVVMGVRLLSNTDGISGVVGLTGASVGDIGFIRADGTQVTYASGSLTFTEVATNPFPGTGTYLLTIPAAVTNVLGVVTVAVSAVGARTFIDRFVVVAQNETDVFDRLGAPAGASVSADIAAVKSVVDTVNTTTSGTSTTANTINTKLGTPAGVSVSADIAAVKSDTGSTLTTVGTINTTVGTINGTVNTVSTTVELLEKLETGRWKIFTTGPNANKMIFYDVDETTPLLTFDLKDSSGAPTSSEPFERVPA